ncbi:protein toll-like isoform X2 [Stegodyphus dumicola]|nr:protein toll-like isoform X2 [Stegodyphus dumicola]
MNTSYVPSIFDILVQYPQLQRMTICDNTAVDLSSKTNNITNLIRILNLRNNSIQLLPENVFINFHNLKELDLSQNKLNSITETLFGTLHALKILDLSFNSIGNISKDALKGFPNLETFNLSNNELNSINNSLFQFSPRLKSIDLSFNNIKHLPETLFHSLNSLENILCSNCNIQAIDKDLFLNNMNLLYVVFGSNKIEVLPSDLFRRQKFLEYVDLGSNKISEVYNDTFWNKSNLRGLNISRNNLKLLNADLFVGSPNIHLLNVSGNKLEILKDNIIANMNDLEKFDLSYNKIKYVELGIKSEVRLRNIWLSHNFIKEIKIDWRNLVFLEKFNMDYNEINSFHAPPCILNVKQTITFSFRHNQISDIDLRSTLADEKRAETDRTMAGCFFNGFSKNFLDLAFNPLKCDCYLYPFYFYLKRKPGRRIPSLLTFINENELVCNKPLSLQNSTVLSLSEDVFSCFFETDCPQPCTCGFRARDKLFFVNCTGTNLSEVPQSAPDQTTVLYFNYNHLRSMKSLNNKIWHNLTELYVDFNELEDLTNWEVPEKLRFLSIKDNKLKTLPKHLMDYIANQSDFQLLFGGNDKQCTCKSKVLKEFLIANTAFIKDLDKIICEINSNGTNSSLPLYEVPDALLCADEQADGGNKGLTTIALGVFFTVLLTLVLIYYKQRQLILSFLYIHCDQVFHICFEECDCEDKLFDAFIAYSSSDRSIVMTLLEELEQKEPFFRLCIHERNWLPGRFITDNIIHSVQNSKRTIIVLSDTFISSPWFKMELRAAVVKVSEDKMNKVIVILVDKSTSFDGVEPDLRHVISKRTYLVWGERWFWEKLRYAMPRKSSDLNDEDIDSNRRLSDIPLLLDV